MGSQDTIAAIASGMTASGIGVVRISGRDAITIADKIFQGADLASAPTHTIHYGSVIDQEEMIDEVLLLLMRAPRTYTREDTVEIDCHGSPLVLKRVLEAILRNGARSAEPGEFTKRAFLNGRIDLTEAESVIDLIHAKNDFARKNSLSQLRGAMYERIGELRELLLERIAYIEAALDDPEHYDLTGFSDDLKQDVLRVKDTVDELLRISENGRLLAEGIRTVIVGKPNAGKSSLLNLLLGEDRAIVTEIAGTTRDTLEETLNLDGILLRIVDTAGIRDTVDQVERIGVDRARKEVTDADLVLFVVDSSTPLSEEDQKIASLLSGKQSIVLLNKSDLTPQVTEEEAGKLLPDMPLIPFSSKEEIGLSELTKTIKNVFFQGNITFNDEIVVTNIRQKESLKRVSDSLSLVLSSIEKGLPEDFYSIDLMDGYAELGRIIGEQVGDDLVNEIFSKFCMGK